MNVDRLRDADEVRHVREDVARFCHRHRLTVRDLTDATRRAGSTWQQHGLRVADIDPDHEPRSPDDSGQMQGFAHGFGYIEGLIKAVDTLSPPFGGNR